MIYSLNGCKWKLMGHWPYTVLRGQSMETGGELMGVTEWVDATVPGSVHADLLRAGLIEDPYFGMNSLKCEWVENRWWQYRCSFSAPRNVRMDRVTLEFLGVDYAAHFYFNGEKLGWHEGMFDPVIFDVTALLGEENRVDVVLEDIPKENSQIGYTSQTRTQKARFGYKWDFCTRMVNLGLWNDVQLKCTGAYRIEDVFVRSDVDACGKGIVRVSGRIDGIYGRDDAKLAVSLNGNGVQISCDPCIDARDGRFECEIVVDQPTLWQVNGVGEQPLYQVAMVVEDAKGVSDEWNGRIGIRSIRYRKNDDAPADSLPYVVKINGQAVYLKGVNMTPLSHMYGTLQREDYRRVLVHAKNMGITLIRVWGGGIIEKPCFYELCDELGILVWQEFIQSSSGLDNIPSKIPEFLKLLDVAARAALKKCRSYTSHAVWSGGNELMNAQDIPATYGDENIAMLAKLCKEYDPDKLFLPTSASGPSEWLLDRPGYSHDIHGNWQYDGIRAHYAKYNESDSLLQSEFGCEGLSSPEGLARILPEAHQLPTDMRTDLVWRHHGEWWDSYDRDTELFGTLKDLTSWSMLSQFVQAEAIRYILEANRRRKYRNSGSFIWQINEPWPNVSCTCLIEHDGTAKMAAYWVKKAFAPVSLSARYDSLICPVGETLKLRLFAHNSLKAGEYKACVALYDLCGKRLANREAMVAVEGNSAVEAFELSAQLPEVELGLIIARLTLLNQTGGEVFSNSLLFTQYEETPFASLQAISEAKLSAKLEDGQLYIVNDGDTAALFVHPVSLDRARPLFCDDSYIILLPGEKRCLMLSADGKPLPELKLRWLNGKELEI